VFKKMSFVISSREDHWTQELSNWLKTAAHEAGFSLVGVAPVHGLDDPATRQDSQRYTAWIDSGHAGQMDYLKRRDESGTLLRGSVATAFPWARSVIVCALDYSSSAPRSVDPALASSGWIARYAWSGRTFDDGTTVPTDYHDDLLTRLRRIEAVLLERSNCGTRCYVDTGPLVERSLAAQAGIGWIGKNTCVINQQLGSWLLLGVILTSLSVEDEYQSANSTLGSFLPAADRCGTCTRCIDACPTDALLGSSSPGSPRTMDASRCIAYLTIEKKGDLPEDLREPIGRNVFGCDICQDVCPWNTSKIKRPQSTPSTQSDVSDSVLEGATQIRPELVNPSLSWLAQMDSREFRRRFRGSPLERTGRKRLLRNIAIAMGNSGDEAFLPQLEQWASPEDTGHPNDIAIRDAAAWACARIHARKSNAP
jgi:epoxyqueuosine reductase